MMLLFVNGTLMRGLALHGNLGAAMLVGERWTARSYRMHSIGDLHPGMYEAHEGGVAVRGELYEISTDDCEQLLAAEPPDLYLGDVRLDDGEVVKGILYPAELAAGHPDVSDLGSWRAYVSSMESAHPAKLRG
ncbi:MAG: allophanate hydrolase-related protein [Acidimicrobiales bacterium]